MEMELNEALGKLQQAGCLVEKMTEEQKAEAKKERALLRAVKTANTADELIAAIQALKAEYGDNLRAQFNYNVYPSLWLSGEKDGKYQWTLKFEAKKSEPEWK